MPTQIARRPRYLLSGLLVLLAPTSILFGQDVWYAFLGKGVTCISVPRVPATTHVVDTSSLRGVLGAPWVAWTEVDRTGSSRFLVDSAASGTRAAISHSYGYLVPSRTSRVVAVRADTSPLPGTGPTLLTSALPLARACELYSAQLLAAADEPVSWSFSSDEPARSWLRLSPAGMLTGVVPCDSPASLLVPISALGPSGVTTLALTLRVGCCALAASQLRGRVELDWYPELYESANTTVRVAGTSRETHVLRGGTDFFFQLSGLGLTCSDDVSLLISHPGFSSVSMDLAHASGNCLTGLVAPTVVLRPLLRELRGHVQCSDGYIPNNLGSVADVVTVLETGQVATIVNGEYTLSSVPLQADSISQLTLVFSAFNPNAANPRPEMRGSEQMTVLTIPVSADLITSSTWQSPFDVPLAQLTDRSLPVDLPEPSPQLRLVAAASGSAWAGSEVTLSAALSSPVTGTPLRSHWRQRQGPPTPPVDVGAHMASVVPTEPGHYIYEVYAEQGSCSTSAAVSIDVLKHEPQSVTVTGRLTVSRFADLFHLPTLTIATADREHDGVIRPDGSFSVPIRATSLTPVRLVVRGPGVEDFVTGLVYIDQPGSTVTLPTPITLTARLCDIVGHVLDSCGNTPNSLGNPADTVQIAELGPDTGTTVINGLYYVWGVPTGPHTISAYHAVASVTNPLSPIAGRGRREIGTVPFRISGYSQVFSLPLIVTAVPH